jgi:hypothetical protein
MMKKLIVMVCLGVIALGVAFEARAEATQKPADSKAGKATKVARRKSYDPNIDFGLFTKDLTLTKEQQKSIKPILAELDKELLPLRKLTYQRLGQKGAPIVKTYYDQIRAQLKPEQLTVFEDLVGKGIITPFVR